MGISYNRNKTKFDYEIPWNEESDAAQYRIGNAVITVTGSRSDEGLLEITFGEVSTIGRRHLKTSLLSFSKLAEKAIVKYKKHESRRLLRRVNRDKNGGSQCRYIAIDI
jgi:hypothetical protein